MIKVLHSFLLLRIFPVDDVPKLSLIELKSARFFHVFHDLLYYLDVSQ